MCLYSMVLVVGSMCGVGGSRSVVVGVWEAGGGRGGRSSRFHLQEHSNIVATNLAVVKGNSSIVRLCSSSN